MFYRRAPRKWVSRAQKPVGDRVEGHHPRASAGEAAPSCMLYFPFRECRVTRANRRYQALNHRDLVGAWSGFLVGTLNNIPLRGAYRSAFVSLGCEAANNAYRKKKKSGCVYHGVISRKIARRLGFHLFRFATQNFVKKKKRKN